MALTQEEIDEAAGNGAIPKEYDEEAEKKRRERIEMERMQNVQPEYTNEGANGDDPIYMLEQILEGLHAIHEIVKENADRDKRIETKMTAFLKGEQPQRTPQKQFFSRSSARQSQPTFRPPPRGTVDVGGIIETPVGQIVRRKPVNDNDGHEWQ